MKKNLSLFMVVFFFISSGSFSQQHQLTKLWETDTTLKVPESVLLDPANKVLYFSNIDGNSDEKDGKGSIGKLTAEGKITAVDWVSGLQAPKGMGLFKNNLYVADLDVVAVIDVQKGTVTKRIPVEGAVFLNDITIDHSGILYVSDSRSGKVHRIENGVVSTYLEKLTGPNGLLSLGNDLYVLASGSMYKVEKNKSLTKIADGMEPDTDGIVHVKDKEFIVSCWGGSVYYIKADGSKEKLLDTRQQKINSADIQYDTAKQVLYVPTFNKNSVVAYQLK